MAESQQHIIPLGDVMPLVGPLACTSNYLPWFYKVSHPYVVPLEEGQPPRGLVRLPPIPVQP